MRWTRVPAAFAAVATAMVTAMVMATALSGCSTTVGDANLVDDWPVMASATPIVPPSGACYQAWTPASAAGLSTVASPLLPCIRTHTVETFHVGQFPASVTALPAEGSADHWAAFDECEKQATGFLGGNWFDGRIYLNLTVPFSRQWDGGGRWYRCDLIEVKSLNDEMVARTASLRDAMKGAATLAQRCTTAVGMTDDGWDDLTPIDCAQPHDAEYAGSFKVPGPNAPTEKQRDLIFDGCWDVVARYMGGTKEGIKVGYLSWGTSDKDWKRGDRWVRCYAWGERKIRGSVRGIGNATPRR